MRAAIIFAVKEFRDGLRNRWVAAAILLLAGLTFGVAFLGSAPVGTTNGTSLSIIVASLSSLSVYLVPLIALMLSYDAIVGEAERGTLLLLLTYPVSRWQMIVGKFLGHLAILAVAILIGFGAAASVVSTLSDTAPGDFLALFALIGSSILLGAVFLMLGYLLSVLAKERATAAGLAVGLWLAMVLLYDLVLLGILMADESHVVGERVFSSLLILNPADAFRVFNLTQFDSVSIVAGLAGSTMTSAPAPSLALCAMAAWAVVAGLLVCLRFGKLEP